MSAYDMQGSYSGGPPARSMSTMSGMEPQSQTMIATYDPLSISSEEATYTCTTCGMVSGFCVTFGLVSNEFPDDFRKIDERAVWVILLILVIVGGCWTILIVEPVTGIFQDDKREIAPNQFVAVPPFGGRGRYPCFVFAFVALVASIWGLLSNEYDAHQSTERGVWIAGLCVWGLMMLVLSIFIAEKLLSGTGAQRRAQAKA